MMLPNWMATCKWFSVDVAHKFKLDPLANIAFWKSFEEDSERIWWWTEALPERKKN